MLARPLSEDLKEVKENTMKISQGTVFRRQRENHGKKNLMCLRNIKETKGAAMREENRK